MLARQSWSPAGQAWRRDSVVDARRRPDACSGAAHAPMECRKNAAEAAEHPPDHGRPADGVRAALLRPSGRQGAAHRAAGRGQGVLFENAYCNSPLCAPSRYSMLAGRLPSRIGAYDNASEFPASALDHRARAARPGLPHRLVRKNALRRPRPAARLRGAADHRHLSGRLRLDAGLGRGPRSGSTGGTTTCKASGRRGSPRRPTSSTSTTRSLSRRFASSRTTPAPTIRARFS